MSCPLFQTWVGIKQRCFNPRNKSYKYYGGRGITLASTWIDDYFAFARWITETLGVRPDGHSLDRIDNDGNYEPGNLRWADAKTQIANRRAATL